MVARFRTIASRKDSAPAAWASSIEARDLALGRDAALKILPDSFTPALRDRLLREADACAQLQHPAIATYYESGDIDGVGFIAMELVPGPTLRERLRSGPLPVDSAVAIVACLLEGLSHAHAVGMLHRDIKPENIILTRNARPSCSTSDLRNLSSQQVSQATPRRWSS